MITLGQLTHLPTYLARNPFHPLLVKFSRYKFGSYEFLFTVEKYLLRYTWLALLFMFVLVYLPLEEYWGISTAVRFSTLVYPCFFIWSLTRLAGVELIQLMLEGHWTAEILALPLNNRAWIDGFVTPVWVVFRQYFLIVLFSLVLYGLETQTIKIDDEYYWGDFLRFVGFLIIVFFNAALWIAFLYLARLYVEVRLRNGLLKGLVTMLLFGAGGLIVVGYLMLLIQYANYTTNNLVLAGLVLLTVGLLGAALAFHAKLLAHFRDYMASQLDIDLVIYDDADPHASAWTPLEPAKTA